MTLIGKLEEAKEELHRFFSPFPKICLALGSGFESLSETLESETTLPFSKIPHMKQPTVEGHSGHFVVGILGGVRVGCLRGRLHYYEGYTMEDVVFPFRLLGLSGAEVFVLTNASGGLDPRMKPPELVLIRDHINMTGANPLIGANENALGPRFPDLSQLYDPKLRGIFSKSAEKLGVVLREGIYVGLMGPSYETPSEVKMYRSFGGDIAGMSTVPEAIALGHMGKKVAALSCVTNLAAGVNSKPTTHGEVLENVKKIQPAISRLFTSVIAEVGAIT